MGLSSNTEDRGHTKRSSTTCAPPLEYQQEWGLLLVWGLKPLDEHFGFKLKNGDVEHLGVPIAQITTDAARGFTRDRLAKGLSNDTVNGSLRLLRRMFTLAHEDKKVQVIPKIRLLKSSPARRGFVQQEVFDSVLKHMPINLRPIITLLYYCGVRSGEAARIEWRQVDLKGGLIRLEEDQTKNEEPWTIPIPDVLVDMLQQVVDKEGIVFDSTNLRKEWYKACAAAGVGKLTPVEGKPDPSYTGIIIHDLRRSAIKNLLKAGVNEKVAMKISGHKTRAVFDRYHIVDTDDLVDAMCKLQVGVNTVKNALPGRRGKLLKP